MDGDQLTTLMADLDSDKPTGNLTDAPAVPATTVAQKNNYAFPVSLYISAGTVTVIAIDGVTTGLTSGHFRLRAGQSIAITYSVVPTWKWFRE